MATSLTTTRSPASLSERAARHLWMHFTKLDADVPILVRGEGCYVWDEAGTRYLDGLAALFCVNVGHGRTELADAGAAQARQLAFYQNWGYVHPPAIELAERVAALAPGDLNRVFFTSGGSEAVESAFKLARNYHRLRGEGTRTKIIARRTAYHGTSMGALTATGITALRAPFEPLIPGGRHVPNTNAYRAPAGRDPLWAADAIEEQILFEGAETVAAVILEPVQNAGGCFVPPDGYWPRVREICDRHGVLLIADEVICAWGRLGHWFGVERFDAVPDLITTAKGLTSAYAPMGALIASDRVAQPFRESGEMFAHGFTFGAHPVAAAVALANLEILEREDLCRRVRDHEPAFRAMLESLRDLPIVGDIRGAGYFWALELVRDQERAERFAADQVDHLLRGIVGPEMRRLGLLARADDRGDPVVQLCPPLIAGPEQFEEIEAVLRQVLTTAWNDMLA
jgi:adenosylmethionine-8-amino-7-oxononanoate aminotransferase